MEVPRGGVEGALGLSFPFRSTPPPQLSPLTRLGIKPQVIFRTSGRPPLALCSPDRIVVQMLKWLHVFVEVDVHSEGRVGVVGRVEVGDSPGGKAQASQHCGGAGVKGGGRAQRQVWPQPGGQAWRDHRGQGSGDPGGLWGYRATCLAQALAIASSFSPLGLSRLLTLINDN